MELTAGLLAAACSDQSFDAGIRMWNALEPVGGPGAPVKPAVYAGRRYQVDRRWLPGAEAPVDAGVIDNSPSQANRCEAALEAVAADLGLPQIVLDLTTATPLPPHLPRSLSGFRFPHRNADAYLRDSILDGVQFLKTDIGRDIFDATADNPDGLLRWFPQALLYGFWQSHLGKRRSQAKLARSWASEILGIDPAADPAKPVRTLGIKGDPLNLSVDDQAAFDPEDLTDWEFLEGTKKVPGGKQKKSLAEIGHGQVPFRTDDESLAGVSFARIEQTATVSFASLRRIWAGENRNGPTRALLVALGLVAHVHAFGRAFSLRSGCDLRPTDARWIWLGAGADQTVEPLDAAAADRLFRECAANAEAAGSPVGSAWQSLLRLEVGAELAKVIASSYPTVG